MILNEIPRVRTITKKAFINTYFKPQKPVVIERLIGDWPAYSKWSLDYMRDIAGDKEVPLYDDRPVHHEDGFNEPHAKMKMADYVNLLQNEPTKYRIFLWNILKEIPELQKDYDYPDLGLKLMKKLPMLFLAVRIRTLLCILTLTWQTFSIFILRERKNVSCFRNLKVNISTKFRIH